MKSKCKYFNSFCVFLLFSAILSFGSVIRENCADFLQISIKRDPIDFTSTLQSITRSNLYNSVNVVNDKVGRYIDLIDPLEASNMMSRVRGIGFYRLGDPQGPVNCVITSDNARNRLVIIDSKNNDSKEFKICGPVIRRKKGFPWFKLKWKCKVLWGYSCSKMKTFGKYGKNNGQFYEPVNLASYIEKNTGGEEGKGPINLWVTDYSNNRIVHIRYKTNGSMEWVNSVGGFRGPIDIAFRDDDETPAIYVAEEKGRQITRIPVTNSDFTIYHNIQGHMQENGIQIRDGIFFKRPTGICLNRSGDRNGWVNSVTYVYVADAGTGKIYRFLETGASLQYINCIALPPLDEERTHIGIRSDKFGTLYAFDRDAGKVMIYSPNLEKLGEFGSPGEHSTTDIKFNEPYTGFITEDNLFVLDRWGRNSGLQRFNIGGIDIVSASVDYAGKTATIVSDNAFDKCTYSIDGGTEQVVDGLQFSGSFTLDITEVLNGLSPGQHTFTAMLRSAYSTSKISTKTVSFVVDPNADRQPRNIKISSTGRRIDVSWDAPLVPSGLNGYLVYANDNKVFKCDASTRSYSYYAGRDQAGETINFKIGALFGQPVEFSNINNFTVVDNSLEHLDTGTEASARSVQELSQTDWNSLPVGAVWQIHCKLDCNPLYPTQLYAEPLFALKDNDASTVVEVALLTRSPYEAGFRIIWGGGTGFQIFQKGDIVDLLFAKQPGGDYALSYQITRMNGNIVGPIRLEGEFSLNSFPHYIYYHSNTAGVTISDCIIGNSNTMSTSIPVTLRSAGVVIVDGSSITLNDAVITAFNGDNLQLSDAQYSLSVPLNCKPDGDRNLTPVNYSITLNASLPSNSHSLIKYSGPQNLIDVNMPDVQTAVNITGAIIKSQNPVTVFSGSSMLTNCNISVSLQNSVIDAPAIKLIENTATKPIPSIGTAEFNLSSNTLTMEKTDGFVTLDGFQNVTLAMSDNLVYQRDPASCFCFANTDTFDLCTTATLTYNTFLFTQECTGCVNSICNPGQNEIATAISGTKYLDDKYAIVNINNPGVILNEGVVSEIRGAIKTIDGNQIDSINNPKLKFWPNLFAREYPDTNSIFYLQLSKQSKVNIAMDRTGDIFTSHDKSYKNQEVYTMSRNASFLSKQIKPGDIYYCYGTDNFGLNTPDYILSFPGDTIFDEQDISNFYGPAGDDFQGKTSTDAACGTISWKVESLPTSGGGYETQCTETFYEPLPDVTGYESFSFYYKKQYGDQQFSLTLEDENGIEHKIQNVGLPSGTRGWYLSTDTANTNWQQAVVFLKDESNLSTEELPISGKIKRLSIHHQSASASSSNPVYMLFDNLVFHRPNTVAFDEQNPNNFLGKGGIDGWDGFTSNKSFKGAKSFQITIKAGNTSTSDEWTGLNSGIDLPVSMHKRKLTFAYKKSDPSSFAKIKLHIQNMETSDESVFEISEQTDPSNITESGWPIPWQNDTVWHHVFIDLFSVRGAGNTDYPSTSFMPFGKFTKIELCLNGTAGAQCLFDDIKFIQDFYTQTILGQQYPVSPDYFENGTTTGWNINCLGEVGKNTIISYGSENNISLQELYNPDPDPVANANIQNLLEIEKSVSVSGTDFPKTYLYWQEKGDPVGYIDLSVECTDGNSYPLVFSPTGYSLNNTRGIFNFKSRSDVTETKHSFGIDSVFSETYPELVNASTPITPVNVDGLKIHYKLNTVSEQYSNFDYSSIEFKIKDTIPLDVTVLSPASFASYGKVLPVELTANKEISNVTVLVKIDEDIIGEWKNPITTAGQQTFSGYFKLKYLDMTRLDQNGNLIVTIKVTDTYGDMITIDRPVVVNWSIPVVSLEKPTDGAAYNLLVPLKGSSNLPLTAVAYKIIDADNSVVCNDTFNYSTATGSFDETITLMDAQRSKNLTLSVCGTSENGMISDPAKRTIFINPLASGIQIGNVNNPTITWDSSLIELTLCNASAGIGGTQDNFQFYQPMIFGNFIATVGVKEISPYTNSTQAGLMVRSDLNTGSICDFIFTSDSGAYYQYRQTVDQPSVQNFVSNVPSGTVWFKMKRVGSVLTYYMSTDGSAYSMVFSRTIGTLPVYIGPSFSSGNTGMTGCATFTELSIEKLPDISTQLTLGITTPTRVLPVVRQDGASPYIEDLSTQNGGQAISISGTNYSTGIGGMPQNDGSPSFCIYDLKSEASRLQVERFVKLTGIGSTQDGATQVAMKIKASSESSIPSISEWMTDTGMVSILWDKPSSINPKNISIDLTNVKWLGIFMSADPMYSTNNGVWANMVLECIGSNRKSPVISENPQSIIKNSGERAVFSVIATGTLPLTYQWQKNHMDIPGATSTAYMTSSLKMSDDKAMYRCVVTNNLGRAISDDAVLTVFNEVNENVSEFALIAKEHLDVRDQVTINGLNIQSNDLTNIGNDGHISANVLAVGDINVGDRTEITGNITAGGSISLGSETKIFEGTVAGGQIVPSVDIESHSVSYGTDDVTVNGGTEVLSAGNYRDLYADSSSILKLGPGIYNFRKFYLESNVKVVFSLNESETANVNIDEETRFGDSCIMSIDGTAGMFSIEWYSNYSTSEIPINPDSWIIGQLIMPSSSVHVYSRSIINGLCHAKNITIEPTAGLNYSRSISSDNQKPVITVPAESDENPVTKASVNLSVQAIDDGGEDSLTYQWTAPTVPSGAWVNFSENGTNSAKNTVVNFSSIGTYNLQVLVHDKYLKADTSSVTLQVVQGTSEIIILPGNATIPVYGTQAFSAVALDQFSQMMDTQPAFTWMVSAGGSINSSGVFTSDGTQGGPYTVTAESDTLKGTANVLVTSQPIAVYKINSGSVISTDPFSADQFGSGGTKRTVSNAIDTSGVTDPAPQAVYQSENYGNSTYTIPNLVPLTKYRIRLHFAELYWNASGQRLFNVTINGATVLNNFDIYAMAGSAYKSIVREFFITSNNSGQIVIGLSSIVNNATIAGIEILRTFPQLMINTGSYTAADPFSADQFGSGGTKRTVSNAIDTSGVTDPAPQAVYQSENYGNSTYTIPNLVPLTNYCIRLHFAELYWNESGQRLFSVMINEKTVLNNFDIYAITGAPYKALVREFTAKSDSSGHIFIEINNITNNATIAGIEIYR